MNKPSLYVLLLPSQLIIGIPSFAYEANDQFSVGGILAGAIQCQSLSGAPGIDDGCETALPFQLELRFRPTRHDEIYSKIGFAAGNGLNPKSPFVISHWAADLEDDVKNINGHNRDYLLTAWYKHTFRFSEDHRLGATMGIVDSSAYLDQNAYANDEYAQFMNAALKNGRNAILPAFEPGVVLEWTSGALSANGILMDVAENDDGNGFSFYGLQVAAQAENRLGTGNYRLTLLGTSRDFVDPTATQREKRAVALFSFDQEFGKVVGGWVRFGWQKDDAAVEYKTKYSGGIDIKGSAWGRGDDNIGLGVAYIKGGSLDIDGTVLAEAYYRWHMNEVFALTADVQYQNDDYRTGPGPSGWTFSLRAVAEF
jgi:Carbohydrate-selective porin, OprB family